MPSKLEHLIASVLLIDPDKADRTFYADGLRRCVPDYGSGRREDAKLTGLSAMMRAVPRSNGILVATSELGINYREKKAWKLSGTLVGGESS